MSIRNLKVKWCWKNKRNKGGGPKAMPGSEKEREVAGVGFKIQTFSSLSRAFKASLLMFLNATYND